MMKYQFSFGWPVQHFICSICIILPLRYEISAQNSPAIEWQKCLGGSDFEVAWCIQQTSDNGLIVAGRSYSSDDEVAVNHGQSDFWVVKLDTSQNIEWEKSFGGSDEDEGSFVQQTGDGGYIVCGATASADGDVTNFHGNFDCWAVKLDAGGNLQWQRALGGSDHEHTQSIQQTADGGFIVAGHSMSTDGDVLENNGSGDYWILKLDADGNISWQNSLGGSKQDFTCSIQQNSDGGFIVAGWSLSNDGDVSGNHGSRDYWLVRLDSTGNLIWQKSLGGSGQDAANFVRQTSDGGFVAAGYTESDDGDVSFNHGLWDYWIVKLDADGNLLWQKSLGGSGFEEANAIQQTIDGGFIVAGYSESEDGDITGNHGNADSWLVKLDGEGNLIWEESLGGTGDDKSIFVQQTTDGSFILAGASNSNDYDVSGNHGDEDYWVVKLTSEFPTDIASFSDPIISVYPNPVQEQLNIRAATSFIGDYIVSIYNSQGRLIKSAFNSSIGDIHINTTGWPDGFYSFQITGKKNGRNESGKFLKQVHF